VAKGQELGKYYVTTLHTYGEDVSLENALVYSDNIYFAKAALKIGARGIRPAVAEDRLQADASV
jgi:cell division protein FtsI/penicillin-binding protein 2